MSRWLVLACLLLSVTPALAQSLPAAPLPYPDQHMRAFALRNASGAVLTAAKAHMTDGKDRVLTYAPVQPNQARRIVVPRAECLDSIVVHLNDGRMLRADHLDDCQATQIVVGEAAIGMLPSQKPHQ